MSGAADLYWACDYAVPDYVVGDEFCLTLPVAPPSVTIAGASTRFTVTGQSARITVPGASSRITITGLADRLEA